MAPVLSVVVPCYNEEEVLSETHRRLSGTLREMGVSWEIVYVNDGSRDGTLDILRKLARDDDRVKMISFSRNFGHQIAVSAGMDHASGDAVVLIDADLQDPPEVIAEMLALWRQGYQVVYGRRRTREGETAFKLATARTFYRILNHLSDTPIPLDTGDFRLMDRCVVESIRHMPERDRFLRGMISWVGYRQCALPYDRAKRFAGESKYPLRKMISFALDGILSFSTKPLRVATFMGFSASAMALLGIVYALVLRLFTNIWVSGWTLMFIALLFMGGVQLLCLGIMGEYIGRIYRESKGRPLYFVAERAGFPDGTGARAPKPDPVR